MFNFESAKTSYWTLGRHLLLIFVSYCAYHIPSTKLSTSLKLARPVCLASLNGFMIVWTTLNDRQVATSNTSCETKCEALCQVRTREWRYQNTFWSDILWVTFMISIITTALEIGIYVVGRYDTERRRIGKCET